jgi:hypothetical protein
MEPIPVCKIPYSLLKWFLCEKTLTLWKYNLI